MYAKLEEEHGLARHAMAVYDRATQAVLPEEQNEVNLHDFGCIFRLHKASVNRKDFDQTVHLHSLIKVFPFHMYCPGLPQSGKNIWKMNFFPGQGKVGILWMASEI